jgi:hypothetical protein
MNNILLNFFIYLIEFICGNSIEKNIHEDIRDESSDKPCDAYFLYDLETFEQSSLYE